MKPVARNKSMTLVEVLVSMVIFTMVLGFMYSAYYSGTDIWQVNVEKTDLEARARIAMDLMSSELKSATRTSSLNPSPNLVIPSQPNNNDIHFHLPADNDGNGLLTDASGRIEWDMNNSVKYQYVPGQKELRRLEKGAFTVIARDVLEVRFIDASIDSMMALAELRIILTMQDTTRLGRSVSYTVNANVRLRN